MKSNQTSTGEATRAAILEVSYRLFTEQGYHGTSMRDIAAHAGITAGSIYNHFTDKEQIVREVILIFHPLIRVLPLLNKVEGESAEALIREAAHRLADAVEETPGVVRLVFIELVDLKGKHFSELSQALLPAIQPFLEKVYATGEVERPGDPLTFFTSFVGMLFGYAFAYSFLDKLPGGPGALEEYIEMFLWGVVKK